MSSQAVENGVWMESVSTAEKHAAPSGSSPLANKRFHLDDSDAKLEIEKSSLQSEADACTHVVSEADVGISAYVDSSVMPIKGGIIKQRFTDFHVREVANDGTVSRISSFYPPTSEEGGTGLFEYMKQKEAERADESGELLRERKEQEAKQRTAKEEDRQKKASRVWEWDISAANEAKLSDLLGAEAMKQIKSIWLEGPSGWKSKSISTDELAEQISHGGSANSDANGGRRGTPSRGRGGRGGGRGNQGNRGEQDPRSVVCKPLPSKEERTAAHQLVRELFEGNLATDTIESAQSNTASAKLSSIRVRWVSSDPARRRYDQRGTQKEDEPPPYIHFQLQKTNREFQDALNIIARSLGLIRPGMGGSRAVRDLSVAGTKDKRAVTVQKVAFRRGRKDIDEVWKLLNGVGKSPDSGGRGGRGGQRGGYRNDRSRVKGPLDALRGRGDRGIRAGHLSYAYDPLHLGMLQGNEFEIVLREVQIESHQTVEDAIQILREKGFINYYGMQRFGTSSISTHTVGLAILRNDFAEAVSLIMAPRPGDLEEMQEARAAYAHGDLEQALKLMPHHHIPERSILQRMIADKQSKNDFRSYFMAIPKGMRTMYVHAYQSFIWNRMVSERVKRFGLDHPVQGDMVYVGSVEADDAAVEQQEEIENEDEAAQTDNKRHGATSKRVKELQTETEIAEHSIHDIIMPLPGKDIQMSETGWMAQVYRNMLAEDKLTPEDIGNSTTPDFALTGDYRKMLHLPRNVSYKLLRYRHANANLCQSDEDRILGIEAPDALDYDGDTELEEGELVAMVLKLTLGVSAYATMALREVLKQDTSVAHQKELSERADRHRHGSSTTAYRNEAVNKIQGKQLRTWGAPKAETSGEKNVEET